ncbi:kinase [Catenulispora subtropica]|uniref:Kinase n=1 Tax=Catenulispora subtropica TaxID=450798 RepID=A0ABN2TAE6_9ACTN
MGNTRPDAAYEAATAFGTFGELLQGALSDGTDFLVTMPIARWSTARFRYDPHAPDVRVRPASRVKSKLLAEALLAGHGLPGGGLLHLHSDLPVGKGLASSSADLVATARAVARAVGVAADPATIEALIRPIEPSDGVMYPGSVAFHHRQVRLRARLGHLPPMTVVGVDEGGEIETVGFNRRPKDFSDHDKHVYEHLLDVLGTAIREGDAATVGQVATHSARMNQRLCPKRLLDDMIAVCRDVQGLGVVAAHSGTVLGVLLDAAAPDHAWQLERARKAAAELTGTAWVDHTLPGGDGEPKALRCPGAGWCTAEMAQAQV